MKGQGLLLRLGHAWRGLAGAVRQERSLRTHLGVLAGVIGVTVSAELFIMKTAYK